MKRPSICARTSSSKARRPHVVSPRLSRRLIAAGRAPELAAVEHPGYFAAQLAGAMPGVWMAHAMFGERLFMLSHHVRSGTAQWCIEFITAFGLLAAAR